MLETRPWVVQKYGGTSVGKLLETITGEIVPRQAGSKSVAIVCSARSGTTKSNGTTNLLLRAIHYVSHPRDFADDDLSGVITTVRELHLEAARNVPCTRAELIKVVADDVLKICGDLENLLNAAKVGRMPRELV